MREVEGDWVGGRITGQGTIKYEDGSKFVGAITSAGEGRRHQNTDQIMKERKQELRGSSHGLEENVDLFGIGAI